MLIFSFFRQNGHLLAANAKCHGFNSYYVTMVPFFSQRALKAVALAAEL